MLLLNKSYLKLNSVKMELSTAKEDDSYSSTKLQNNWLILDNLSDKIKSIFVMNSPLQGRHESLSLVVS